MTDDSRNTGDRANETTIVAWDKEGIRYKYCFALTGQQAFALVTDTDMAKLQGESLRDALWAKKIPLTNHEDSDGEITPAVEHIHIATDFQLYRGYYENGKRQNPERGMPALLERDLKTGVAVFWLYCKDGKEQNPFPHCYAEGRLDPKTNVMYHEVSWMDGLKLSDNPLLKPAEIKRDRNTGYTTYEAFRAKGATSYLHWADSKGYRPAERFYDGATGALTNAIWYDLQLPFHKATKEDVDFYSKTRDFLSYQPEPDRHIVELDKPGP